MTALTPKCGESAPARKRASQRAEKQKSKAEQRSAARSFVEEQYMKEVSLIRRKPSHELREV